MCAIKMIIFILIRKKENIGPKLLILQIIVIEGDDHVHPLLETDSRTFVPLDPQTFLIHNIFQPG